MAYWLLGDSSAVAQQRDFFRSYSTESCVVFNVRRALRLCNAEIGGSLFNSIPYIITKYTVDIGSKPKLALIAGDGLG